jgi:hypothetical protein
VQGWALSGGLLVHVHKNFVVLEEKRVNSMNHGEYSVGSDWYTDTGATNHITNELDKMVIRDRYMGGEQIHTANSSGMDIENVGHVIYHTPHRIFFSIMSCMSSTPKRF